MKTKTVTLDDVDYIVGEIDVDTAESLGSGKAFNRNIVCASLNAAKSNDGAAYTDEQIGKLPFFAVFIPLLHAVNEVNGLAKPGEAKAGEVPAVQMPSTGSESEHV